MQTPTDWFDYPMNDFGWTIRAGYVWWRESPEDAPIVEVVAVELVTRREVPLELSDIPGIDLAVIEADIIDKIEMELMEDA